MLCNCAEELHFSAFQLNGSCTLIKRGLNGNGTGTAVPLHGRNVETFYSCLLYIFNERVLYVLVTFRLGVI